MSLLILRRISPEASALDCARCGSVWRALFPLLKRQGTSEPGGPGSSQKFWKWLADNHHITFTFGLLSPYSLHCPFPWQFPGSHHGDDFSGRSLITCVELDSRFLHEVVAV